MKKPTIADVALLAGVAKSTVSAVINNRNTLKETTRLRVVEAIRGLDAFPDVGPYAGPEEPVYGVAFHSDELFGRSPEGRWTIGLDLFESYLEPAA